MLLPFLGQPCTVEPLMNRTVLFLADQVLHRGTCAALVELARVVIGTNTAVVNPAVKPRVCFTIWMDGPHTNTDEAMFLKANQLTMASLPLLQATPLQRTLSRAVYDERMVFGRVKSSLICHALTFIGYVASLQDCFGAETRACKLAVAMHHAHIKQLRSNSKVAAFVDALRAVRAW